jgi:hypothetical protein
MRSASSGAQDRERLKQAAEQLLKSQGWQRWVPARARNGLARYSVSNLCLIVLAKPDASFVAGFRAWLDLEYCVRKGERAIRIFAPMPIKDRDATDAKNPAEARVGFARCRSLTGRRSPRWTMPIRLRWSRRGNC